MSRALKRAIYTGRVNPAQARRTKEMQAVADACSHLANIIMAWNTMLGKLRLRLPRCNNAKGVYVAQSGRVIPK